MNNLLLSFHDNYADEFDLSGFAIISEEAWQKNIDRAEEYFSNNSCPYSHGFGTNEELEYETILQYRRKFTLLRSLNPEESKNLLAMFQMTQRDGIATFGEFPLIATTESEDFEVYNG